MWHRNVSSKNARDQPQTIPRLTYLLDGIEGAIQGGRKVSFSRGLIEIIVHLSDAGEENLATGRRRGRTMSAKNYTTAELETLLTLAKQHLPISGLEWENKVAIPHQARHNTGRTGDSLKRKFDSLANTKMPTGDPNCPPHVRQAKHIRRDILVKVELTTSTELEDKSADEADIQGLPETPVGEASDDEPYISAPESRTPSPRRNERPTSTVPTSRTPVPRNRDEAIVQGMQAMAAAIQGTANYEELRNEIRDMRTSMMDIMRLLLLNRSPVGERGEKS